MGLGYMDVHYTGLGPLYHLTCFLGGVILLLRIPYGLNIGLLVGLYRPEFTGHRLVRVARFMLSYTALFAFCFYLCSRQGASMSGFGLWTSHI